MTKEKNKIVLFLVWVCITMFYCYQFLLRALPNIAMPDIMSKYSVGASEFGSFAGIYYIGYILVHIPIGILLSRFGAKLILPIFILLTAAGLVPLVYSDSWTMVILGRMLTGVGSSAAIVGALQIFRIIYPASFTKMLGFMVFFGIVIAVYASKPFAEIIKVLGVAEAITILIYLGIGLSIATYILMPSSTSEHSASNITSDILAIIRNYRLLFASICAGLMVGPLEGFADAWGSSFLISVYSITKVMADDIILSIYLGMCTGCIILPYIADKTRSHFTITIISGIVIIGCFCYILSERATGTGLYYACAVLGTFCAYQVIIISKITTFVSEERSGMAGAVVNMIVMAFGWLFHNFIGITLEKKWTGDLTGDIKIYNKDAFISGISIIPVASAIAIVGLFLIVALEIKRARRFKNSPS
jgi:predicted MFS family arabinose efflux permease